MCVPEAPLKYCYPQASTAATSLPYPSWELEDQPAQHKAANEEQVEQTYHKSSLARLSSSVTSLCSNSDRTKASSTGEFRRTLDSALLGGDNNEILTDAATFCDCNYTETDFVRIC